MFKTEASLECLCPICLSANALDNHQKHIMNQPQIMRCQKCMSSFEIIIANGVDNVKNVIVMG
ncbi:hypothetical protein [Aliiglaciecola aliphaticivorans]